MPKRYEPPSKPRGRPPIYGDRVPLGLRVSEKIKAKVDDAAKASGRSLSQEAELRLENSFQAENAVFDALDLAFGRHLTGLILAMAHVAQITGTRGLMLSRWDFEGCDTWLSDPYCFDQVVQGVTFLLEQFRPSGEAKPSAFARAQVPYLSDEALNKMGIGFAEALLGARTNPNPTMIRSDLAKAIWERLGDAPAKGT
jgi:hypothetical protein